MHDDANGHGDHDHGDDSSKKAKTCENCGHGHKEDGPCDCGCK